MENKELADKQCFECGKSPSDWASINNGIFLCLRCSADHRDFGTNISFIKSLTLDVWSDNMFKCMQMGGNYRLRQFLNQAGVPGNLNKKQLYSSKLMGYYRRLLKSQVSNSPFYQQMPTQEEYWLPDQQNVEVDNIYMSKIDNSNPLPFQMKSSQPIPQLNQFNPGEQRFPQANMDPNFPKAPPQEFPKPEYNPNFPPSKPQYPSLNPYSKYPPTEDEYSQPESYSSNNQYDPYSNSNQPKQSSFQNPYQYGNQNNPKPQSGQNNQNPQQQTKGFEVINNSYSNPNYNQYPNKGNDVYSQYNKLYGETGYTESRSVGSNVSNFFSKVWDKTKETTSNIKDKYNDSKFGQTMNKAGQKTVAGMKTAGNKIAETSHNIANSQAMQNVKTTTTNSYTYVKNKIAGSSNQPPQNNHYNYY